MAKKLCEHANQFSCKLGVLTIIVVQHAVFFLFKFVWCTWVGDHPHDDLAKFSYRWERDVEKFRNARSVLMACYSLLSKSGDFKKIPHNVVTLGHLFPQETRKTNSPSQNLRGLWKVRPMLQYTKQFGNYVLSQSDLCHNARCAWKDAFCVLEGKLSTQRDQIL